MTHIYQPYKEVGPRRIEENPFAIEVSKDELSIPEITLKLAITKFGHRYFNALHNPQKDTTEIGFFVIAPRLDHKFPNEEEGTYEYKRIPLPFEGTPSVHWRFNHREDPTFIRIEALLGTHFVCAYEYWYNFENIDLKHEDKPCL